MNILLIFTILIAALFSQRTNALDCYSCSNCGDPFSAAANTIYLNTCNSDNKFCMKTTTSSLFSRKVIRECAKTCTESSALFLGLGKTISCCAVDKCNSSTSVVASMTMLLLTMATLLAIRFKL